MKRSLQFVLILTAAWVLSSCSLGGRAEQRTLRVTNYGHTKTRAASLQKAVDQYNVDHPGIQYTIEFNQYIDDVWDWDSYIAMTEELLSQKGMDDLAFLPGEHIGKLASEGYLLPLDEVIADSRFQEEYFAPLLPKTEYLGHTWGLLLEMDLRTVYVSRDILARLGYSQKDMEQMPERIRTGELTMADLENIGKKAVEQGLSSYAIAHRPRYGVFFYAMAQQFHAFSINEDETINFDEENFEEMLRFYERISQLNKEPQPMEWSDANDIFIQGRAAVYLGANWTIYDCVMERGGDEETLLGQYVVSLLPALHQGESPFTSSNTMQVVVSVNCENPEAVKEILANAYSDWDTLADHCAQTYRLPVAKSVAASPSFQENDLQAGLLYMMDYAFFMPYNSDNQRWLQAIYQAVRSVENGTGTPEEVAHMFALDLEEEGVR